MRATPRLLLLAAATLLLACPAPAGVCGDLIVEVASKPGNADAAKPDGLRGICWRVLDIDATRTRLVAAGIDVSDVRIGRRPGSRVMTVKSGTCGVPTLLIEKTAKED